MTAAPLAFIALTSAEPLVTVIGDALPPPVVPAPNPVGEPTADATPGMATVSAEAAATAAIPASPLLTTVLRMTRTTPWLQGSFLIN